MSDAEKLPGGMPTRVQWQQVWGLTGLLAAHSLGWMAYDLYQPQLLRELGLVNLAIWLGIGQGLLGMVVEPVVGGLSDRVLRRLGSRLPLITTGVTLAGLIFVAIALLLQVQLQAEGRWLVPLLMTVWVMAMISFRGPVVALLRQTAPLARLPRANTALTIIFGLVGALEPLLEGLFQQMGAAVTFMLGAIGLVLGAAVLYLSAPAGNLFLQMQVPQQIQHSRVRVRQLAGIFLAGLGAGLAANLLLRTLATTLQSSQPALTTGLVNAAVLLIAALSAVPLEQWLRPLGSARALLLGIGATALTLGLVALNPPGILAVGLVLVAGVEFGLIFTSQIPFALQVLPTDRTGLATGLLFGGIGAATALLSVLLLPGNPLAIAALGWALVATGLTAVGIKLT